MAVFRFEELSDVVLCGQSYGGMVITGVADQVSDAIRLLVYLDAFVPSDGQALQDLLPKEMAQQLLVISCGGRAGRREDTVPTGAEATRGLDS